MARSIGQNAILFYVVVFDNIFMHVVKSTFAMGVMMAQKGVAAVDRALRILQAFLDSSSKQLTLAQLARATGFYKSTVLRLCESLENAGFLTRQTDGTFRLGPATLMLGSRYQEAFDLGDIVMPALRDLAEKTGESVSFYVLEGEQRVCLYRINSRQHRILHFVQVGTEFPRYTGASGQIFEAFGPERPKELEEVRQRMTAASLQHRTISETGAVAAPVFDQYGGLVGTLSVSGPINRFNNEMLDGICKEVLNAASVVTRSLGGDIAPFQ